MYLIFNIVPIFTLFVASVSPNTLESGINIFDIKLNKLSFINYYNFFQNKIFWEYLINTIIVSVSCTLFVLFFSYILSFVITRYNFRGKNILRILLKFGYVFPPIVLVFPYQRAYSYITFLNDSLLGLVVAHIAFCLPFAALLIIEYFDAVPLDYDKNAQNDGANWYQRLIYILFPYTKIGIISTAVFIFILSWNDITYSSLLIHDSSKYPLSYGIYEQFSNNPTNSNINTYAASSFIVAVVAVIIFGGFEYYIDEYLKKINKREDFY